MTAAEDKKLVIAGSIEPQTETVTITATTVYNAAYDKDIVKASVTPTESTEYNGWTSAVYQITST